MMNQYIASNCEIEEFNDYDTQAPVVQMPGTSMPPMPMMPMTPIPPMTPSQSDVPQLDSPTEDSQTDFVDTWSKIRDLAYALKCGAEDNLRCGTVVDLGRIDDIGQELNRMVQKVTEGDDNKKRLPPPLIRPRRQRKKFDEEAKTVALIKKSSGSDMYCHSCGTTDTVEWRRGPDGSKSLCNACGLHYAKMIKREMMIPNRQTQRSVMSFSNILS